MPYELAAAWRYLVRSKSHKGFVAFFTILSILGVAAGVMLLIVVLAVMTGFERELKAKVIGMYAHVTVTGMGRDALADWRTPAAAAAKIPHVVSTAPYVTGPLLLGSWHRMRLLYIIATDTTLEREASELERYITVGSLDIADDQIIMGEQGVRNMGIRVGDRIQLTTAATVRSPDGRQVIPLQREFEVAGLFHTGNYEYDANYGIVTLKTGQELYSLSNRVHALKIKLDNVDAAPQVQAALQDALGPEYNVRTWMDQNRSLFSAVQMEKRVMFTILMVMIGVIAFNIISTLVMVVLGKMKEIGILRALGATRLSIGIIFTLQGILISAFGTLLGVAGGVAFALNIDTISKFIERHTGFTFFPSNIYYLDKIPADVVPVDVIWIVATTMVVTLAFSFFPAWYASRLDPVQSLRYE